MKWHTDDLHSMRTHPYLMDIEQSCFTGKAADTNASEEQWTNFVEVRQMGVPGPPTSYLCITAYMHFKSSSHHINKNGYQMSIYSVIHMVFLQQIIQH